MDSGTEPIAGVRYERRDRRRADPTGVACNGEQIPDGIIGIRRDIPLPVNNLREPAKVVVDVLRLVGVDSCRPEEDQPSTKMRTR